MAAYEDEYLWVLIIGGIIGFLCAFGIGANDLANSFGSSVATKALTMWQCVLIAAVCEFSGALLLGAGVTDTIQSGVAKIPTFSNTPDILLWGMFSVMIASAFWDNFACYIGLPVSTTHTTVGAIVGMSLVSYGSDAVLWMRKCKNSNDYCGSSSKGKRYFPLQGVIPILISWLLTPLLAGVLVSFFYGFLRQFVLRSRHSFRRVLMLLPYIVGFTFALITACIVQTGSRNETWKTLTDIQVLWIACAVGGSFILLTYVIAVPLLYKRVLSDEEKHDEIIEEREKALEEGSITLGMDERSRAQRIALVLADINAANPDPIGEKMGKWFEKAKQTRLGSVLLDNWLVNLIGYGSTYDVHASALEDPSIAAIWANAEIFDFKTERLFRYLQIFSAMVLSFAHGSNDVANAMGPFSSLYHIYKSGKLTERFPVPLWVLVLGASGMVLGLSTFGYRITRVVGVKTAKLTNTRGFCVELSTAFVVTLASRFGFPVSTTQIIVGAIFAIGLFEGQKGINWKLSYVIVFGWVITLFIAAGVSAIFQSIGIYSPHKQASQAITFASKTVLIPETQKMIDRLEMFSNVSDSMIQQYNQSLNGLSELPYDLKQLVLFSSKIFQLYNDTFIKE